MKLQSSLAVYSKSAKLFQIGGFMRFESYLSTHPYYGFDVTPHMEKGVLNNKISWVQEFKGLLNKRDLTVKVISTIKGEKIVIYMHEGFNDELKKDGTSIVDTEFVNFSDDDLKEFEDAFSKVKSDIKEASSELQKIIKEMKFVDPAHHIYFISNEDEE